MADFPPALEYVLQNEGTEYVDIVGDRGGPTRYGITLATLTAYRQRPVTPEEVRDLDLETVHTIYRRRYWNVIHGSRIIDQGLATMTFDCAVLMGPMAAIRILDAALESDNPQEAQLKFVLLYQEVLVRIALKRTQNRQFLDGWLTRVQRAFDELCDAAVEVEPGTTASR